MLPVNVQFEISGEDPVRQYSPPAETPVLPVMMQLVMVGELLRQRMPPPSLAVLFLMTQFVMMGSA